MATNGKSAIKSVKASKVPLIKEPKKALLTAAEKEEFRKYEYPFENLAFEGGGCKGIAYTGVIRALEEIGIWRNMRRFAGTSAGSFGAMVAALGYDSHEIEELMSIDLGKLLCDATLGTVGFPMLMKRYGLHPGRKFLKWLGDVVSAKLGDPDATFADLYNQTGRELCVIAVNVNQLDCEYLHVKTTPDMPLRIAVRMSSGIPGLVAPVKYKVLGVDQYFCDGGLIVNYPIHVFDGWFLSMEDKDTFLQRVPNIRDVTEIWDTSQRFGTEANKNTIGIMLYSETEQEVFKVQLNERIAKYVYNPATVPDTKYARLRQELTKRKSDAAAEHDELIEVMSKFVDLLKDADVDCSGTISRDELKKALEKAGPEFGKEQRVCLFGKDLAPDALFDTIDENKDGEITLQELLFFAEQRGIHLQNSFRGFESKNIARLPQFFDAILETLLLNMKKIFMRGSDLQRTIGVNTMYLDTLDFHMEPADKEFLLEQGKDACIAFLRYHIDAQEIRQKEANGDTTKNTNGLSASGSRKKFYPSFKNQPKSRRTSDQLAGFFSRPFQKKKEAPAPAPSIPE